MLTSKQVSRVHEFFDNNLLVNIKLSKTHLPKIVQLGEFLGRLPRPLLKNGLSLMKNVLKCFITYALIPLGLSSAVSAAEAGIHKKIIESGMITSIVSNKEMDDIMKIIKSQII